MRKQKFRKVVGMTEWRSVLEKRTEKNIFCWQDVEEGCLLQRREEDFPGVVRGKGRGHRITQERIWERHTGYTKSAEPGIYCPRHRVQHRPQVSPTCSQRVLCRNMEVCILALKVINYLTGRTHVQSF